MIGNERALHVGPIWSPADQPPIAELLNLVHEGWRSRAACRVADWSLFEPAGEGERLTPRSDRVQRAAAFCVDCPVLARCRAEADARKETGTWAMTWRTGAGGAYRVLPIPVLAEAS